MVTRTVRIILLGMGLSLMANGALAKIIFVDGSASGANNGATWPDAFKCLRDAIKAAVANDEIRVATGTYRPDCGKGLTPGDRNASFVLKNLVKIIGGYPAGGGATPDWQTNQTILSGDLLADDNRATLAKDLLTDATRADNSYHVVRGELCISPTILDGLTITAGQADGADILSYGGGLLNISDSSPTILNCVFTRNAAIGGGALYNSGGPCRPILTNVTFSMNYAGDTGGGVRMVNTAADVKLDDCHFTGNYAVVAGAGIMLVKSAPQILNCDFTGEYAGYGGAAICDNEGSNPTVTDSIFTDNSSSNGGAIFMNVSSSINLNNCTFSSNTAVAGKGGACHFREGGTAKLDDCYFMDNATTNEGGAIFLESSSLEMSQCTFFNNAAGLGGGAIYNYAGSPILNWTKFIRNHSASHGGAFVNFTKYGIPVYLTGYNCLFSGNYVTNGDANGGAIGNFFADHDNGIIHTIFKNSTFYNNAAMNKGGGLYTNSGESTNTLYNCILYKNSDTGGSNHNESAQIYGGTNDVRRSCVQGFTGYPGYSNIGSDPQFADPLGPDWIAGTLDDDLRPTSGSPCVDSGKNDLAPSGCGDLDGMPRRVDDPATPDTGVGTPPIVDMGAYEYIATECVKDTAPFFADWVAWDKPACWCRERQCRGDINGKQDGVAVKYWVSGTDLGLFKLAYAKNDAALKLVSGGICSDLNHKADGIAVKYRVSGADLGIFKLYYAKADASVPACDMTDYNFWLCP